MTEFETHCKHLVPEGHSNFVAEFDDGAVKARVNAACFSYITYTKAGIKNLRIFFPRATDQNQKRWIDYVINRSAVSSAFVTKSVDEGLKHGFELNLDVGRGIFNASLLIVRHAHEFSPWPFVKLVDMGLSEVEAFYFLRNFTVSSKGFLSAQHRNSNHFVQREGTSILAFKTLVFPRQKLYTSPPSQPNKSGAHLWLTDNLKNNDWLHDREEFISRWQDEFETPQSSWFGITRRPLTRLSPELIAAFKKKGLAP